MVGGLIVYFVINYNIKKEKEKKKGNKIKHNMRYKYKVRELGKEIVDKDIGSYVFKKIKKKVRP